MSLFKVVRVNFDLESHVTCGEGIDSVRERRFEVEEMVRISESGEEEVYTRWLARNWDSKPSAILVHGAALVPALVTRSSSLLLLLTKLLAAARTLSRGIAVHVWELKPVGLQEGFARLFLLQVACRQGEISTCSSQCATHSRAALCAGLP
jgi:hypothetical protein